MKRHVRKWVAAALFITAISFCGAASAQVYVKIRPEWHAVVRPAHPGHGEVWIDEDWSYRDGHYVAAGGHWSRPPHDGWVWVPGHWSHGYRGYYWKTGHWRRV